MALLAAVIELARLCARVGRRGAGGVGFQGAVPTRVAAMLLGLTWFNDGGGDAQTSPPGRQWREAGEGVGGPGPAVISAEAPGETDRLAQAGTDRLGLPDGSGCACLAPQEKSALASGPRAGVAVAAVAGADVAREGGGPDILGRGHQRRGLARMTAVPAVPLPGAHSAAPQDVAAGGAGGPMPVRRALLENGQARFRAPGRMMRAPLAEGSHSMIRRLARTAAGRTGARSQATRAVAVNPRIAGCTAHTVERAQRGDRQAVTQRVGEDLRVLVQSGGVPPGPGAPPSGPVSSVYL